MATAVHAVPQPNPARRPDILAAYRTSGHKLITTPPIPASTDPGIHLLVSGHCERCSCSLEMHVEVRDATRGEYNVVALTETDSDTRLVHAQFAALKVSDREDEAAQLVHRVSMGIGSHVEIDDEAEKGGPGGSKVTG